MITSLWSRFLAHPCGVAIQVRTPCKENTYFFGMWFLSVKRVRVKSSGCANIFVRAAEREWTERNATDWRTPCRKFLATPLGPPCTYRCSWVGGVCRSRAAVSRAGETRRRCRRGTSRAVTSTRGHVTSFGFRAPLARQTPSCCHTSNNPPYTISTIVTLTTSATLCYTTEG